MSDEELLRRAIEGGEEKMDGSTFRALVAEVKRLRRELEMARPSKTDPECLGCGETIPECRCDDWDEHDARAIEDQIECACPFCFCHDWVEIEGDVCSSCRNGAHQG